MSDVIASDGTVVTRQMLDDWSEQSETGNLPGRPGPIRPGRPLGIGDEVATPVTVRLDAARRRKLEQLAKTSQVSKAQIMRDLLDRAAA